MNIKFSITTPASLKITPDSFNMVRIFEDDVCHGGRFDDDQSDVLSQIEFVCVLSEYLWQCLQNQKKRYDRFLDGNK